MREKLPAVALPAVALAAAALVSALAPSAAAAQPALPLPLPAAGTEPLLSEAIGIEGPLIQNVSLPTLK